VSLIPFATIGASAAAIQYVIIIIHHHDPKIMMIFGRRAKSPTGKKPVGVQQTFHHLSSFVSLLCYFDQEIYAFLTPLFDIVKPLPARSSFPVISIHLPHHYTFLPICTGI